ncbi:MAG TPA: TrkA family potassium uptake protein [Chloroflexia bacterium]|jgi:trk system potassium uptake protein TrkA|nr:TrkA family potassium uptake protein [Chloroflexia bacterium]
MKIVIMGCGRVGARLAQLFDQEGHDVAIVDLHTDSFDRLGPNFHGTTMAGTGIDEDVLKSVGIEHADLFLAVTNRDNSNIMAAQIAKMTFRVPRVIARIYEPDREETFHHLNLETICPTTLISNRIYEAVTTGEDAHIARVEPVPLPTLPAPIESVAAGPVEEPAGVGHAGTPAREHRGHSLRQRFFR